MLAGPARAALDQDRLPGLKLQGVFNRAECRQSSEREGGCLDM